MTIRIEIPQGESVEITLRDTDGAFVISYDEDNTGRLTITTDLPDSHGRNGLIYEEKFGLEADAGDTVGIETDEGDHAEHVARLQEAIIEGLSVLGRTQWTESNNPVKLVQEDITNQVLQSSLTAQSGFHSSLYRELSYFYSLNVDLDSASENAIDLQSTMDRMVRVAARRIMKHIR